MNGRFMLGLMALAMSMTASAANLGTIGPVYPIKESHAIEQIKARLLAKQASGELARLQEDAAKRARATALTPASVAGLSRAVMPRHYIFDPSVRVEQAMLDQNGRVIVPPGTVVNPLELVSFDRVLLFFDGRDPGQVKAARAILDQETLPVTAILVGGTPMALMRVWDRRVFFDQGGRLVARFGIKAVPATVRRNGLMLQIDEVAAQ